MSFRAIWIDEGSDADRAKLRAHDITEPFYSVRDPRVTLAYLDNVQSEGFDPGIYAAWNWPETGINPPYEGWTKGAAFATWLSKQLARIAPNAPSHFPTVCADIETHSVLFILGFLSQWRKHRAARVTDWTLEGFQGGLFSPIDTLKIAAANVRIIPQLYAGDMRPLAADRVALDLVAHSFPPARIFGFYDAAALPGRWEGYAFTQGRLP